MDNVISIKKIYNNLIIKHEVGDGLFISTKNSLIISIPNLCTIIRFLVMNNFLHYKVLEGILEEYNSFSGDLSKYDV